MKRRAPRSALESTDVRARFRARHDYERRTRRQTTAATLLTATTEPQGPTPANRTHIPASRRDRTQAPRERGPAFALPEAPAEPAPETDPAPAAALARSPDNGSRLRGRGPRLLSGSSLLLSVPMRWTGWAAWLGVAAASLALGAMVLVRPRSPVAPRVASGGRPMLSASARRALIEPSSPPRRTLPSAALPSVAPRALSDTRTVHPDSALPSTPRVAGSPMVSAAAPPAIPAVASVPAERTTTPVGVSEPRRISLASLADWSKPGLCSTSEEVEATRQKLTASFRSFDGEARGQLHLDPRLPQGIEQGVLALLAQARAAVEGRLVLQPEPPQTFVYADQQLMKAAACINEDVVAFYDGALHLVANRNDLQQSVTHELTHHALFSSGLAGPAWAQEGIAMLVAQETWWRAPARLQALQRLPFSSEQMEGLIPYKLPADQAIGFYVQSALTVQCLLTRRGWSLQQLTETLRHGSTPGSISYDLPELQQGSFVSSCLTTL